MKRLNRQSMLAAMRARDEHFNGVFFFGVRSTGIFCLPSCRSRRPLPGNVVFFRSRESALSSGYRGCKRCRSESYPDVEPRWLRGAMNLMRASTGTKLSESEIARAAGVDISTVRRYFRAKYATTPMAFHRSLRLAHARTLLDRGADYLSAAFESGFDSASGFRDAYRKHFGHAPGKHHES